MLKVEESSYFESVVNFIESNYNELEDMIIQRFENCERENVGLDIYYNIETQEFTKSNIVGISYGPIKLNSKMIGPNFKELLLERFRKDVSIKNELFMNFDPSLNNIEKTNRYFVSNILTIYDIPDDDIKFILFSINSSFSKNRNKIKYPNIIKMIEGLNINILNINKTAMKKFRRFYGNDVLEDILNRSIHNNIDNLTFTDVFNVTQFLEDTASNINEKLLKCFINNFTKKDRVYPIYKLTSSNDDFFNLLKKCGINNAYVINYVKNHNTYNCVRKKQIILEDGLAGLIFNNTVSNLDLFSNYKFAVSDVFIKDMQKLLDVNVCPNKDFIKLIIKNRISDINKDNFEFINSNNGSVVLLK